MLKIIRWLLYGAAITVGAGGLFIGGVPLVKYLLEMLHDPDYRYYYDTSYLNEPEMIFLLSLILLIGVRIAMALDRRIQPASLPDTSSSGKKPVASAPANEVAPPSAAAETPAPAVETADEKLTRLLNRK